MCMLEEKQSAVSRLTQDCKKKIDTTMIGALSAVEAAFGHLWGHKVYDKTDEQQKWFAIYEQLRSFILDNGNNQKRKLDDDLAKYEVEWKRYNYQLRVATPQEVAQREKLRKKLEGDNNEG